MSPALESWIWIWKAGALRGTSAWAFCDAVDILRCLDLPTLWKGMIVQDCGINGFIAWKVFGPDGISGIGSLRMLTSNNSRIQVTGINTGALILSARMNITGYYCRIDILRD
jgi:hypothetical protein